MDPGRGAAIDVFPIEPASSVDAFHAPLRALDNVILTPHAGGSTVEVQRKLGIEVSEKLRDHLLRGAIQGSVNLPDLAAAGHNVSQLHLETGAGMGAAVVDLDAPPSAHTPAAVRAVEGTVRAFVALATPPG